ncbi:MAG: hypothetical protein ACKOA2_10645 [Ilumatobacteraceae bacterium]
MSDRSPEIPVLTDGVTVGPPTITPDVAVSWWRRAARRVVRRPREWFFAPWTGARLAQYFTALVVLLSSTVVLAKVVHIDLVLTDNTPTGGDMGAHVLGPAYLRDHLLPNWQLSGWSNDWYNGFPIYRFYMLPPAVLIVILNTVLAYGVAFKIVAVAGILTLPLCCWAFGRLARFSYPIPELMAIAALAFLFDESFSIYGGNIKSTMAGEFAFSIALSLGVLGLGLFAHGLETGRHRSWTAIVIALAMLSHGLVLLVWPFLLILMWLIWMDRTRFVFGLTTLATVALLVMFWFLPFASSTEYMTDMKYGFRPSGANDSFWDMFFPWPAFLDIVVSVFAAIGFATSVARRQLTGAFLGAACIGLMGAVVLARDSLPVIGLLWNPRLLPFLYILRLLLMMVGIADVAWLIVRAIKLREPDGRTAWVTGVMTVSVVALISTTVFLFLFREVPGGRLVTKNDKTVYAWGIGGWDPITLSPTSEDAVSDGWTRYNFGGYEGRPAYGEYKALVDTMARLGDTRGCGRALWENNSETGAYGTTMALMLLPHWTDGCIGSSEGLFFEASGSTPYHFLAAAAMSQRSSNPVRELRYTDNTASVGVPMLQKLGIRYVMLFTEAAKNQATVRDDLTLVAESGPWQVWEVADSNLVVPLARRPVVVRERPGDPRERALELGTSWFQNSEEWVALPAFDGPSDWQRIDAVVDLTRANGQQVDVLVPDESVVPVDLPQVVVDGVVLGDQDLTFRVSEPGVPVLIRMSYFPNWRVDGAEGPFRVAPNFMVVVPTSTTVTMRYETTAVDRVAQASTLLGIGLLVLWRFRGDVLHQSPHPFRREPDDDEPDDDGEGTGSV